MNRSGSEFAFSHILRNFFALACFCLAVAPMTRAQDWGQWRGPERKGLVPASHTPKAWPASLQRVWRVETGEGYASPLVSKGRVFVHSRQDPEEIVTAIDYATGKQLWQQTYSDFLSDTIYLRYATSSPTIDPETGNVYMQGTQGILAGSTADGRLLWKHSMMESFGRLTFPNSRTAKLQSLPSGR